MGGKRRKGEGIGGIGRIMKEGGRMEGKEVEERRVEWEREGKRVLKLPIR